MKSVRKGAAMKKAQMCAREEVYWRPGIAWAPSGRMTHTFWSEEIKLPLWQIIGIFLLLTKTFPHSLMK
jgi:hypothetical protein